VEYRELILTLLLNFDEIKFTKWVSVFSYR
jgi:hypothetical protein